MKIAFLIWTVVYILFLAIAISCRRAKEASGFFTFSEAPKVNDVKSYNKAVSNLWFIAGTAYEIIGIPFLFLEQNSPYFLLLAFSTMIWVIALIVSYLRIEAKYKK